MPDIAFHGDPAVKAQALERLRRHVAAGSFVYFPAWEDGKANVIGAVVEADDTPLYAERTGYPLALAETLPVLVNAIQPPEEAIRFSEAWLERTPVGADLSRIPSQLVRDLLERPSLTRLTARHPALEQARHDIAALHARAAAGDQPDRKAWKAARLAAVEATDGLADDSMEKRAGSVVEAAAWPGTMRSVLRDTVGAFGTLELRLRLAAMNWTEEEENRTYHIRKQAEDDGFEDDGFKAELSGLERMFAVLDAADPVLGERFRQRCDCMVRSGAFYLGIGRQAIALMEQAPLSAASGTSAP